MPDDEQQQRQELRQLTKLIKDIDLKDPKRARNHLEMRNNNGEIVRFKED